MGNGHVPGCLNYRTACAIREMASSVIPISLGEYSSYSDITSQTNAAGGKIYLLKHGKIRQLEFVDAKTPSNDPHFSLPTMDTADRPMVTTECSLRKSNQANHAIWIRINGTFGQANGEPNIAVNGTLTWIVE